MQPKASLWLIRASLIYFAIGAVIGAGMFLSKAFTFFTPFWLYLSVHVELMLFGWILQLFMGTAFWMLPRHPQPPTRGPEWKIWLSFALMNAGIFIFVASSLFYFPGPGHLLALARVIELSGVIVFINSIWPRVRPFLIIKKSNSPL